jgi:hypothetical protein
VGRGPPRQPMDRALGVAGGAMEPDFSLGTAHEPPPPLMWGGLPADWLADVEVDPRRTRCRTPIVSATPIAIALFHTITRTNVVRRQERITTENLSTVRPGQGRHRRTKTIL